MSVKATNAVFDHSATRGAARLVILAIADEADDFGICWPGVERLGKKAAIHYKNISGHVAKIRKLAEVAILDRPGTSNVYVLLLPGLRAWDREAWARLAMLGVESQARDLPPAKSLPPAVANAKRGATHKDPKELDPKSFARFADFWEAYPARHGFKREKKKALDQWNRLTPEQQELALRGVRSYAAHCKGTDTFPKDAFRWLRDRSFEEWAEIRVAGVARHEPREPLPTCEHGMLLKAVCPDCEAEGIPQAERRPA